MAKRDYPNGYLPKIAYHSYNGNIEKLEYFTRRQIEKYGPLTPEQLEWMLAELHRLSREVDDNGLDPAGGRGLQSHV